jgi:tetratricopeptide (TPR) repeat protein
LGKIRRSQGTYLEALQYYNEAESLIIDEVTRKDQLAYLLVSKGLTHWHLNDYDRALSCYEKSLALCKETGNLEKMGHALNNIGLVYMDIGMYKKALGLFEQALDIAAKRKDRRETALNIGNIGMVYFYMGKYIKRSIISPIR